VTVISTTQPFPLNQIPPGWCPLPVYTVYSVKNVTCSEKDHGRTVAVMANTAGPAAPDFDLPIKVVVKAMHKISERTWGLLGFSDPLCGQEIRSPQFKVWVGKNKNLITQQWTSLHLTSPPHDSWVQSHEKYYRPISDPDCHSQGGTRKCRQPETPGRTIHVPTVGIPDTNFQQLMVEPTSLACSSHSPGV